MKIYDFCNGLTLVKNNFHTVKIMRSGKDISLMAKFCRMQDKRGDFDLRVIYC